MSVQNLSVIKNKILAIDDSATIRSYLRQTFQSEIDIDLLIADSGYLGLSLLTEHPDIKLVILDINMPGIDGLTMLEEFNARLLRLHTRHRPKIIVCTSEASMDLVTRAKAAGANGWLIKPIKPAQLILACKKLLATEGV